MPTPLLLEAPDLPTAWKTLVPTYTSAQYRPLVVQIKNYDGKYAKLIEEISWKRTNSRWENYVDPLELMRVKKKMQSKDEVAIRFGVAKGGHGYHGERGDFCLIGAAIQGKSMKNAVPPRKLTLFYRSVELIGGLAFDLAMLEWVAEKLEVRWTQLSIMAANANVFAVRKNSNEKLYPKIQEILNAD